MEDLIKNSGGFMKKKRRTEEYLSKKVEDSSRKKRIQHKRLITMADSAKTNKRSIFNQANEH